MSAKVIISLFCVLGLAISATHATCTASASVSPNAQSGWQSQGRNNSVYTVTVSNSGTCSITSVSLNIAVSGDSTLGQSWNLESSSGAYTLTNFGGNIAPSSSFTGAGFILSFTGSAAVQVSVSSVTCSASCSNSSSTNSTSIPSSTSGGPAGATLASDELLQELELAVTEVKREALLTDNEFVFDFVNALTGITQGSGGKTVAATRENFPAIIGHGVAMTVGFIDACGINLPHTHPRATEINFIVSGEFQAGFFTENGAHFVGNTLKPGMATIFPQGAIHFEINIGCQPAMFVAAFNNEDPGVQTTSSTFFGLPANLVASNLNISNIQTVEDLAAHLPKNPALLLDDCRQRCGLN